MAIAPSDLAYMLSVPSAAGGALVTQPSPNASLGKYVSTTLLSGTAMNNLFDNVSGKENAASVVEYRCLFVQNNHATLTALNVSVWLAAQVAGGTTCTIGADPAAASIKGSSSVQAATIALETNAPSGVTFSAAASANAAVDLSNLAPGYVKAIWIKRSAANTGPKDADGITLELDFDTME